MHRTILLMICLLSVVATDAQRQRMSSEVHREYKDGRWQPVDSMVYEYIGNSGSVDMKRDEFAQGYDTRTAYRMDHGKYRPDSWESIDYDSAGHPVLYTFQDQDHKKWVNRERFALSYSPQGDTLSYALEEYDVKQKSWHPAQTTLYSYDSLRRCVAHTLWGDALHYPYRVITMDSFQYDDRGLLTRFARLVWDTSMQWRHQEWQVSSYNDAKKLVSRRYFHGSTIETDSFTYDSEGRVLLKLCHNNLKTDPQYTMHPLVMYRYGMNNTTLIDYYVIDPQWERVGSDSICYDSRNNVVLNMHLDHDGDSIAIGDVTTTRYDSLGVFISYTSFNRAGDLTTPVEKDEKRIDRNGLPITSITSEYLNGRWEYKEATFYRYEPVPEK